MEDFIKKMIEVADAAGKELKVEISKEKESYRITPKKELHIKFNNEKGFELTIDRLNVIDMSIAIHALTNELVEMTGSDAMYIFGTMIQTHEKFNKSINKTNKEVKHV